MHGSGLSEDLTAKRLLDVFVSGVALALLAPLGAVLAAAVLLESGKPIFYKQRRVGRGFREFDLYKFRSMRINSHGPSITIGGDRRITRVGAFLRSTKLDELPQLWNVFRGEMSLVGPRPEVPEYVEVFRDRYALILTVVPGITDLASIRFRNEEEILAASSDPLRAYVEEVLPAKLDLAENYLERRSMIFDLRILFRTLRVIVART
jgi:lipopolysaccharide/colanic/teichoic acid biosynthesis glycosyltransferase